jgi:hypothetical protein
MDEEIRLIRTRLRRFMNGVVSSGMRDRGIGYKLNFGVSVPVLKEIAKEFLPSSSLADKLWEQGVREMKILATLLHPVNEFTKEKADEWAFCIIESEIAESEIAGQYVMNLLQYHPEATLLAGQWILREEPVLQQLACLLYSRLFMKKVPVGAEEECLFLREAKRILEEREATVLPVYALNALKKYGKQSGDKASQVLQLFAGYNPNHSLSPTRQSVYEELCQLYDEE